MKSERDYRMDLLHYIDRIEQFTAQGRAAFVSDDKTYYAVIRGEG